MEEIRNAGDELFKDMWAPPGLWVMLGRVEGLSEALVTDHGCKELWESNTQRWAPEERTAPHLYRDTFLT